MTPLTDGVIRMLIEQVSNIDRKVDTLQDSLSAVRVEQASQREILRKHGELLEQQAEIAPENRAEVDKLKQRVSDIEALAKVPQKIAVWVAAIATAVGVITKLFILK